MPRTVTPTPETYAIRVTISGGTAAKATYVRARNRRTLEYTDELASSNSVVLSLGNLSSTGNKSGTFSGFTNGDVIDLVAYGRRIGSGSHTVVTGKGGGQATLTVADITSTTSPEVNA